MVSLVAPCYNNLRHVNNLITSYLKWGDKNSELIIIDDASNDGTYDTLMEWKEVKDSQHIRVLKSPSRKRVGHTVLYDWGIDQARGDVVGILHADMIIGKDYIKNMLKHLKPGTVVCATRVEPPLHPPGKEKIILDFGLDFDTLDVNAFDNFVDQAQIEFKDLSSQGMFAPWILMKKDWEIAGGHDHVFAPFPFEDSDIFQRWILNGFTLIQSRDAFVYHLTCRGHKWTKEIKVEDDEFATFQRNAGRNYNRKWGTWIENDENCHPVIHNKYDIGIVVKNCSKELLAGLEIWCSDIYTDCPDIESYIREEQQTTMYDMNSRVHSIHVKPENDIVIRFDAKDLTKDNIMYPNMFNKILAQHAASGLGDGQFVVDIFEFFIKKINPQLDDQMHTFKKSI